MNKKLKTAAMITALIGIFAQNSNAQFPFFTAQTPPNKNIALENRIELKEKSDKKGPTGFKDIIIFKAFNKYVWGYLATPIDRDGIGDIGYGIAPKINIKDRLYFMPTIEGKFQKDSKFAFAFAGATIFTTIHLGREYHIDLHPKINNKGDYTNTYLNLGKTYNGITYGLTSNLQKGREGKSLKQEAYFRIAKINKGNFCDIGFNPNKKKIRFSMQRAW